MTERFRTLVSTKVLTLDEKNRIMLPVEWRRTFEAETPEGFSADAFVLIEGTNGKAWLFTESRFEKQVQDWSQSLDDDEDVQEFQLAVFGTAKSLKMDKAGRLTLPEDTLSHFELKDNIAAVGNGNCVQLWDPQQWEDKQKTFQNRLPLLASRNREKKKVESDTLP